MGIKRLLPSGTKVWIQVKKRIDFSRYALQIVDNVDKTVDNVGGCPKTIGMTAQNEHEPWSHPPTVPSRSVYKL